VLFACEAHVAVKNVQHLVCVKRIEEVEDRIHTRPFHMTFGIVGKVSERVDGIITLELAAATCNKLDVGFEKLIAVLTIRQPYGVNGESRSV
jgi:hypothetical protein